MSIPNTTYRVLVEKLGSSNPSQFIGNEGEVFYDPNNPVLRLSDGSTPGGVSVSGNIEIDPVFGGMPASGIGTTNISNWNTAYSWGNHADGGYLTSYTETDPVFSSSIAAEITSTDTSNWNTAYGWGNHADVGYLTSFSETDPTFVASIAAGIGTTNISNWNTAYGWGDHSVVGYQTATSTSYAQTLIVDPNGSDVTGNGGPNAPFKTLQAAHDYAVSNNSASEQVIVKLNGGSYSGNLLVTRPNTHFVGPNYGQAKSTRLVGIVTVSTGSSVGGTVNDMVTFENMLIATGSNSGTSVVTVGGTIGCAVFMKDVYVFTSSTSAKCLDVTSTAPGGVKVEMKNVVLQNQSSSGITANLSNTYYANIDSLIIYGGTGPGMEIATTNAVVYNSRFENVGVSTVINVLSSFTGGQYPALVLGSATIANPSANGNGINLVLGAVVNVAQVAFNVGTSAGTGFAVKGVAGSVFVNGNNLIVPGTNSKVSSAIGAGNIPLGTSLTPA